MKAKKVFPCAILSNKVPRSVRVSFAIFAHYLADLCLTNSVLFLNYMAKKNNFPHTHTLWHAQRRRFERKKRDREQTLCFAKFVHSSCSRGLFGSAVNDDDVDDYDNNTVLLCSFCLFCLIYWRICAHGVSILAVSVCFCRSFVT